MIVEIVYNVFISDFGEDKYTEEAARLFSDTYVFALSTCFCIVRAALPDGITPKRLGEYRATLQQWKDAKIILDFHIHEGSIPLV